MIRPTAFNYNAETSINNFLQNSLSGSDNKNIIEQLLPPPEQPIIEDANQTSENIEESTAH